MKKLFFLITLLCVMLNWTSSFAYDFSSGNINYNITNKTLKTVEVTYALFVNSTGSISFDQYKNIQHYRDTIEIPSTVDYYNTVTKKNETYTVTKIGDRAFEGCYLIKDLILPNTIDSIGNSSLYNCLGLKKLVIPFSVKSIGNDAFYNTANLNITIPSSVSSIGNGAFDNSKFLKEQPDGVVYINNVAYCIKGDTVKTVILKDGTEKIALNALNHYYKVIPNNISITLPSSYGEYKTTIDGVYPTTIYSYLKYITLPSTINSIGGSSIPITDSLMRMVLNMNMLPTLVSTSVSTGFYDFIKKIIKVLKCLYHMVKKLCI